MFCEFHHFHERVDTTFYGGGCSWKIESGFRERELLIERSGNCVFIIENLHIKIKLFNETYKMKQNLKKFSSKIIN